MAFGLLGYASAIVLSLGLAGCATDQEKRPRKLACVAVSALKNTDTPPDLYHGMVDCVDENNYASAVYFFALAGTYTYYDTLRVADKSAHQAHTILLQESLDAMGETRKQALWEELKKTLANPDRLPAVCREIAHIGAPRYYPRYMIQHGMNAYQGDNPDEGVVEDFAPGTAWKKALRNYLHCIGQTVIG